MKAKAIFITADFGSEAVRKYCYKQTEAATNAAGVGLVYQKQPTDWRLSHESIYNNILAGIKSAGDCDYVYICEHDCIYPAEYFKFHETDSCPYMHFSYSLNMEYLTEYGFVKRPYRFGAMSTLAGTPKAIIEGIHAKLAELRRDKRVLWTEPNDGQPLRTTAKVVDIRHGQNFTGNRGGIGKRKDEAKALWEEIGC